MCFYFAGPAWYSFLRAVILEKRFGRRTKGLGYWPWRARSGPLPRLSQNLTTSNSPEESKGNLPLHPALTAKGAWGSKRTPIFFNHGRGPGEIITQGMAWPANGRGMNIRCSRMRIFLRRVAILSAFMVSIVANGHPLTAQTPLPVLARVGPWPIASEMIGFQGRLWFVNSVKYSNHNSADLYSIDPATGSLRYERHLFSQDAGQPVIFQGLLYWPFEDARFSLGWGHFMATDGKRWLFGTIPGKQIFHTHALTAMDGNLYAATSAWQATLQVSRDRGLTWQEVYAHPTSRGRVSRIVALAAVGGSLYGYLLDRNDEGPRRRLLRFQGDSVGEVPGWPQGSAVTGLTPFRGWLYGLVGGERGTALWRTNGVRSEQVRPTQTGLRLKGLTAGPQALWAVSVARNTGRLWRNSDGNNWTLAHTLPKGAPNQALVYKGRVYVTGAGENGRGILWGSKSPPSAKPAESSQRPRGIVKWPRRIPQALHLKAAGRELDKALFNTSRTFRGDLRDRVYKIAVTHPGVDHFSPRLKGPLPNFEVSLIGGKVQMPASRLARWILLWGMSLTGIGEVPPELISTPWNTPPNRAEKYFAMPEAAIWAVAMTGQKDRATLNALLTRLKRKSEPLWVKGEAVGALTVLTGRRFAYDFEAWHRWWAKAEADWPK